jgi:CRP-like cAMP-binding protein
MAPSLPKRSSSSPPESLGSRPSDLPVDHALSLLLADEVEPALRWSAAALDQDPWSPGAIIVTSRILSQMGRTRAAVDGMLLAVQRAIESGDLPLAIVAIDQLRGLGVKVSEPLDDVANAFCRDSGRLHAKPVPRDRGDFQPLSPLLTGEPLASKAAQILLAAKHAESGASTELAGVAPLPLFSALSRDSLREFLEALETTFVPSGYRLLQEGKDSGAAFIVATGTLEISRRAAEGASRTRTVLGRVGSGALVGEVALMSHLPSAASVIATTASILLVARRGAVEPIAAKHAELGVELAAFCRRHAVANLGWSSSLISAVPAAECASLVERLETRTFERGEKLVAHGEDTQGLHLIVSGEVAVVAREGGGRVMLATRLAGETVGEVELVLCQKANVDAIAVRSTATLLLPPDEFFALVRESPATLHGLYAIAVRRHAELRNALEAGSAMSGDEWALDDASGEPLPAADGSGPNQFGEGGPSARGTPPPPLPREASLPTPTPPPVGTYDALNGSGLRATAASRASAPSPFSPASSFAPARYSAAPGAAHANPVPHAPSQAPASFIPPAPGPAPSQLGVTVPTPYPPPSPFTPPPNVAYQGMPAAASVAPSVASASFAPRSRAAATMVLAAVMTVVAIVLLTVTVLGKRPAELLGPAPAAGRQGGSSDGVVPPAENAFQAPVQPAPAAPPAALAPAPAPPRAPVVPAFKAAKAPATATRASESASSSHIDSASSTSTATVATSAATPVATSAATAAASSAPPPAPVSTPASASSDDFGGRQ